MLCFRDLLICALASFMASWCGTEATAQHLPAQTVAASGPASELDLSRLTHWLNGGLGRRQLGPNLFQVPVGSSQMGYVSFAPLDEGPTALLLPGIGGTNVLVRIFVPATGYDEVFLLYVPTSSATEERPLLTGFHGYGISHGSIATLTSFLREAETRQWFLIAPIQSGGPGFAQVSYGTVQSQEHVAAVIDLILNNYTIDRDRLYAVGFSMGGGCVTGYAARHRDRRKGAFAAIVNHTGTVSLSDTYQFVNNNVKGVMEALFMGTPTENPFDWTRASSIVLDSASQLVPGAEHMAINLTNMPMKTIYGIGDTNDYQVNQSIQLDQFFQSVGATNHILEPTILPPNCPDGHCWHTADEAAVCDWFETITLNANPISGTILTDRAGRSGRYDVTPEVEGEFTQVDFSVDTAGNAINFSNIRNLRELSVDLARVGLDANLPITFKVLSEEPGGDTYRLRSIPAAPLLVIRNSQQVGPACPANSSTASWCIDVLTGDLLLSEPGGASAGNWRIQI